MPDRSGRHQPRLVAEHVRKVCSRTPDCRNIGILDTGAHLDAIEEAAAWATGDDETAMLWHLPPHSPAGTPKRVQEATSQLVNSFEAVQFEDDPLLGEIEWITRETPAKADAWRSSKHPDIRFYLATNPLYDRGTGLVTLVPFVIRNPCGAAANHVLLAARHHRWRSG